MLRLRVPLTLRKRSIEATSWRNISKSILKDFRYHPVRWYVKDTIPRPYWNVHTALVKEGKSLRQVFQMLQKDVETNGLHGNLHRKAVDTFYFHCANAMNDSSHSHHHHHDTGRGKSSPPTIAIDDSLQKDVLDYFHQNLFHEDAKANFQLNESLNEATFAAVINIYVRNGQIDAAWSIIRELQKLGPTDNLHFRTVRTILEYECQQVPTDPLAFPRVIDRWHQLKHHGIEWSTAMEDTLVDLIIACEQHYSIHHPNALDCKANDLNELLLDLRIACQEISSANAEKLQQQFHSCGFKGSIIPSDHKMHPACKCCGTKLDKLPLTSTERSTLISALENRGMRYQDGRPAIEVLEPFKAWLLQKQEALEASADDKKLHYILDGPNLAYLNQNFDMGDLRLDHIEHIANDLLERGHAVTITLPQQYLHDSFLINLRTKKKKKERKEGKVHFRQRTDEDRKLVAKWQENNLVYSCDTGQASDDLYWLYASALLGPKGRVVTNDLGRDHVDALLHSSVMSSQEKAFTADLIERWIDEAIVNVYLRHVDRPPKANQSRESRPDWYNIDSFKLFHPLPFSRAPQRSLEGSMHFPIRSDSDHTPSQGVKSGHRRKGGKKLPWLCLHKE